MTEQPIILVDSGRCRRDGLCAAVCPVSALAWEDGGLPAPHPEKHRYCIGCGQCLAVCPAGALTLGALPDKTAVPVDRKLLPGRAATAELLRFRRSVRAFRPEPVNRDRLTALLDLTQYAPSGFNARPVRWVVADTPEKVAQIGGFVVDWMRSMVEDMGDHPEAKIFPGTIRAWESGTDIICRNAPALALAVAPKTGVTPHEDAVVAITYLELAATADGLGACWAGFATFAARRHQPLRDFLGIASDEECYGGLMLGRPARKYAAVPPRPGARVGWV